VRASNSLTTTTNTIEAGDVVAMYLEQRTADAIRAVAMSSRAVQGYDSNCNGGESRETVDGVLDSASTHYISSKAEDFSWISDYCNVKINGCGGDLDHGKPVAYFGKLKDNTLGLQDAIYFEHLPSSIGRIVPTKDLRAQSWGIHLLPGENTSYIESQLSGVRIPVRHPHTHGLPEISFEFGKQRVVGCWLTESDPTNICGGVSANLTKIEAHRRDCHFHIDGIKVHCPDCDLAKGKKCSFIKLRAPQNTTSTPLKQLDADFYGQITPESIRRCKFLLVFICDAIAFAIVIPIRHKDEAPEQLRNVVQKLRAADSKDLSDKVVHVIRCDNEPVLRSKEWTKACQELMVKEQHSIPYCPPGNGVVERFMDTLGQGLRVNMVGVDDRLWCYCAQFLADRWNQLPRKNYTRAPEYNGLTPLQARRRSIKSGTEVDEQQDPEEEVEFWRERSRRFGCLAFVMVQPREKLPKAQPKFRKMVYLGFSRKNAAWLFGCYTKDDRKKDGYSWNEFESKDAKFREGILISDLELLRPDAKGLYVPEEQLLEENLAAASCAPWSISSPAVGVPELCAQGRCAPSCPDVSDHKTPENVQDEKNDRERPKEDEKKQENPRYINFIYLVYLVYFV